MKRAKFILVPLVGLALVGGWAALNVYRVYNLPHPDQASRSELMRWLVLKDVSEEPEDVQIALVDRLTEEAKSSWDTSKSSSVSLSDSQKQRLAENAELLKQVWFNSRVDRYRALERGDRFSFLEEQIDTIDRWTDIADQYAESFGLGSESAESLFDQIDRWVDDGPDENRPQTMSVLKDAVVCWLSTRDLDEQSMATRRSLAVRIASELDRGLTVSKASGSLSGEHSSMLRHNSELLMEAWIYVQLDDYRHLDAAERDAFVENRIAKVKAWGILEFLGGGSPDSSLAQFAGALRLQKLFGEWIDEAAPHDRADLEALYESVLATLRPA